MSKPVTLDEAIAEMRTIGEQLVPYNFPMTDRSLENYLNISKVKEIVVDGYSLFLHYSKADYRTHYSETVQIYGKHISFLPFNLVVKIAKKFLGSHKLVVIEQLKEGQKIYCWSVMLTKQGKPMDSPFVQDGQSLTYEDFTYSLLDPSNANIF